MRRFVICSCTTWIVFAVLTASGCSNSSQNTSVIAPTPVSITEEFTGTLNVNGAAAFPFQAGSAGLITSTLTTLGPDSTLSIGLSLGTWNGTACAVPLRVMLANPRPRAVRLDEVRNPRQERCSSLGDVS